MTDPQKKYEFTGETKTYLGRTLHRIRALAAIPSIGVAVGDSGGWIEKDENLSHTGDAWVYGNAQVYGDAGVFGNARVFGDARVYGNARADKRFLTVQRSDGYTFSYLPTPVGPRLLAGCRCFTLDEARAHWQATRGGTRLGDESLAIVDLFEKLGCECDAHQG